MYRIIPKENKNVLIDKYLKSQNNMWQLDVFLQAVLHHSQVPQKEMYVLLDCLQLSDMRLAQLLLTHVTKATHWLEEQTQDNVK